MKYYNNSGNTGESERRHATMDEDRANTKFIVLDPNCVGVYTHHWSSVLAYCSLLSNHHKLTEVWLPKNSSKEILHHIPFNANVKLLLRASQYSESNLENDWLGFFCENLMRFFPKIKNTYVKKLIRYLLIQIYTRSALKELRREINSQEITLIFPTLDYMSLQLLKLLLEENSDTRICVRRMGSEEKHPLATGNEFIELLKLVSCESYKNLRIGIPTEKFLQYTRDKCAFPERIFWSPLPPDKQKIEKHEFSNTSLVRIGFPGTVKARKGYDRIPNIVKMLINEKIEFELFVQRAQFPWDTYEKSREQLMQVSGNRFIELDKVITVKNYENLFSTYDVVILPYNQESYANADSGILYEASDFGVPIICYSGLGFSDEAFKFGIGYDLEKIESFKSLFQKFRSKSTSENFKEYNKIRESAILDFLNITDSAH